MIETLFELFGTIAAVIAGERGSGDCAGDYNFKFTTKLNLRLTDALAPLPLQEMRPIELCIAWIVNSTIKKIITR